MMWMVAALLVLAAALSLGVILLTHGATAHGVPCTTNPYLNMVNGTHCR
jgi:hypothetical protein